MINAVLWVALFRVTPSASGPKSLSVQLRNLLRDLCVAQTPVKGRHRTISADDRLAHCRIG